MAFEELQVENEPGVWFCARHKTTKTRLRCGRCEKPICPKCTVFGPTGARCRECASNRDSHMYQTPPQVLLLGAGVGAAAGALGAVVVSILFLGFLWLFALLYAPAIGPVVGRLISRVTGGKRGPKIAIATMLGLVVGAVGAGMLVGTIGSIVFWVMLPIALVGVWGFLK